MAQSMFERYGGFGTISKIVMSFYDRLLDDDDVGVYFEDVDLPRLIDHQTKFIASIMGGPAAYTDDHLRRVHAKHEISAPDFERTAEILAGVLTEAGLSGEDLDVVLGEVKRRAPFIITEHTEK